MVKVENNWFLGKWEWGWKEYVYFKYICVTVLRKKHYSNNNNKTFQARVKTQCEFYSRFTDKNSCFSSTSIQSNVSKYILIFQVSFLLSHSILLARPSVFPYLSYIIILEKASFCYWPRIWITMFQKKTENNKLPQSPR